MLGATCHPKLYVNSVDIQLLEGGSAQSPRPAVIQAQITKYWFKSLGPLSRRFTLLGGLTEAGMWKLNHARSSIHLGCASVLSVRAPTGKDEGYGLCSISIPLMASFP